MIELNQAEHEHMTLESGVPSGRHPHAWRAFGFVSKLISFILLAFSVVSILLPYAGRTTLSRLGESANGRQLVEWLINQNGSWIVGAGFFVLFLLFALIKRTQIVRDQHLWYDAGCPQCFEHELVRVPRRRSDRWYSLIALPAFRYACRNCTWQGLRIARRHVHVEPLTLAETLLDVRDEPKTDYIRPNLPDDEFSTAVEPATEMDMDVGMNVYDEYEDEELPPTAVTPDVPTEYRNGVGARDYDESDETNIPASPNNVADKAVSNDDTDDDWSPFADEELESEQTFLENPPTRRSTSTDRQQTARKNDDIINHKVREQDDEFDWLWRRLGHEDD